MSLGDEYKADYAFEHDYHFGMASDVWTTKDGSKVKLTDMTDAHIRNCMRMVSEYDPWHDRFEKELRRREFNKKAYTFKACYFYPDGESGYGCVRCSNCGKPWFPENDVSRFNYCPNCGYKVVE